MLRAARLGFHWCKPLSCFLRVSGSGPFAIVLCSPGALPSTIEKEPYRVWWEDDDTGSKIVDGSPALSGIVLAGTPIDGRIRLVLDDEGRAMST